jgi:hypothetical protein
LQRKQRRWEGDPPLLIAMDAQKKAELRHHLNGIAAILYEEVDTAELTTLEDIEKNVRNLAQEHVLPQLGIFLSTARPAATLGSSEP